MTARLDGVAVNEQRSALVRDDDVEDAAIPQIRERDRAPVERIPGADNLGDVGEAAGAIVHPHALPFVAGEAAAAHRRPVLRVRDDAAVPAGDYAEVVPVILPVRR